MALNWNISLFIRKSEYFANFLRLKTFPVGTAISTLSNLLIKILQKILKYVKEHQVFSIYINSYNVQRTISPIEVMWWSVFHYYPKKKNDSLSYYWENCTCSKNFSAFLIVRTSKEVSRVKNMNRLWIPLSPIVDLIPRNNAKVIHSLLLRPKCQPHSI